MKFGPVSVGDAEGAVLAHSIALTGGRLRKGHILAAQDIAALKAEGIGEIIVARLGAGDVGENAAAESLARALSAGSQGLRLSNAFTGRVNLLADGPGIAMLDVAAIEAANLVDQMITVATVPAFQQMSQGGLVATIKIISYGVSRSALDAACARGRGAVSLRAPNLHEAALIITEIPGGAGEKGRKAIEARLNAFGVRLTECVTVAHDAAALRCALERINAPLVLILTGSATSDIEDVGPSALTSAGGRVARFGMPVDPGNLLFLGSLGTRQVIGLPGCARSPALNGADWVLARVICGVPVSSADIAAMGVGGLLKEIPTRPQPRNAPKGQGPAR